MKRVNYSKRILFIVVVSLVIISLIVFPYSFSEYLNSSAWDGVVATSFTSGTGSSESPYIISDAGEFAYLKTLLESEDAAIYSDKHYKLTSGFNYGGNDISINSPVAFSGTIDGDGNLIYNATVSNYLFNVVNGASFKNLELDITYSLEDTEGAILAKDVTDSNFEMIIVSGTANVSDTSSFGGLVYTSTDSNYENIVLNYDINSNSSDVYKFAYEMDNDEGTNILIKDDNYDATSSDIDIGIDSFSVNHNAISLTNIDNLDDYVNDDYEIIISNNKFMVESKSDILEPELDIKGDDTPVRGPVKAPTRGAVATDTITEHASGADGNTFYINDLTSDLNYYRGLNYAEVRSTSIPSGVNTGYYNDNYLVKVEIIYDGADIESSARTGALSPIGSENTNKFIYFKYYPLARNSSGTLLTNSDGDNYIHIELIDNPFTKRPYVSNTEYGFNGWICNQGADTTANLCSNATFSFNNDDYTRHLEVPVNGGSEIIIHLNASWYKADVVTSASSITSFNSMSMQPTNYTTPVQVEVPASYYWKQNYAQMVYNRTVNRNGALPRYYWYKTSQTGTSYTYIRNRNATCGYTTCYVYSANQTAIQGGSKYEGGSVSFVPNFTNSGNNTEVTITTYDTTYMNLQADPDGEYTITTTVQRQGTYIPGTNASGYYYRVSNPTTQMINTGKYYNSSGTLCTSTSGCSTAYKLIHYDDDTLKSNGNTISLIETDSDGAVINADNYYYLVTRDMNIFRYTSGTALSMDNLEVNRPFTVTGAAVNGNNAAGLLEYDSSYSWYNGTTYYTFAVENDLVIENIRIDGPDTTGNSNSQLGANNKTGQVIHAGANNLKIGRNVTSSDGTGYLIGEAVLGGTNTNSGSGTYRVIIESGFYYAYHSGAMSGSTSATFNETTIFGSDYDRINNTHNKLKFLIGLDGYAGGRNTAGSDSLYASYNIIKSGRFGYNSDDTPNSDNTAGLYIGCRSGTYMNSLTGAKIEGGIINTVVGGYGYNGTNTTNSTFIGMSGGTVRSIYGGAGHSTTKGNRIICVTGGTVSYSILGGSDSYDSGDTDDGIVQGSTLVYVGGNVTVGGGTGELYGVEAGSVFGAGGGDTSSAQKGTVYNSHVIINGGTINTAVYGGGNHGSTGTQYAATSTAKIEVLSGTVGSVYGGSKSAGFSQSNYQTTSTIDIDISGGTIGNVYGGSNTEGTIYGLIDVNVTGGTITGNVYGGGRGGIETSPATNGTTTTNGVTVTIGDSNNGPTISGNVYGGSAFGSVNATNRGNVNVTVNKGTVSGSVFGGGQGDSTHTPTVNGNITVNINGGNVTNVFGGNDQAGTYSKNDHIYLNGGTVGSVYGGGNRSSVTTTNVHLQGSTVTTIYGGSNAAGAVTTANVNIASGTVGNVYGGNNSGGSCATTNVDVTGTATVQSSIYGGGNQVNTTTTNVALNSAGATIPNVYGGGNQASVTTANITNNGVTVGSIFGGSNSSGTVGTSIITHNSGTTTNIYGGNNAGGSTLNSTINYISGTTTNIFGGGNEATHDTTAINVTNGNITNIYGGGNNEGVSSTTVTVGNNSTTSLTVGNVYGGSNAGGTVTSSAVIVNTGTVTNVYGGNNLGGTLTAPNVTINNGTITGSVFGGGNQAVANGGSTVTINNGTIGNVYGAGNLAQLNGNTNVKMLGGTVNGSIFGGGNEGVVSGNTVVTLKNATVKDKAFAGGNGSQAIVNGNTTINVGANTTVGTATSTGLGGSVFGSGNQAATGTSTSDNSVATVNITGGTIYGNVYGGANTSVVYGTVALNIGKNTINNNTLVTELGYSDITINGTIFGGGESNASGSPTFDYDAISVTQGINIKIDATGYNNFNTYGSIFGSGNASNTPANKPSTISIKNYGSMASPHFNLSIQRVKNLVIDNSAIELAGVRDSTDNMHPNVLFSLNRIEQLILKNNSSLFLRKGTNYLEEFNSQDASGNKASVTIDSNGVITNTTVDNRLYMVEGEHMNVAHDGGATDYANVYGMTFFGMYTVNNNNVINTKMYEPGVETGDRLDWSDIPVDGSYVLGKHEANHDITVDGFYSHFYDEVEEGETKVPYARIDYIDPTPEDSSYYYWMIGETITEYTVNLEASKYATLGTVELILRELSAPNTSFEITGFDYSGLTSGINLVNKSTIRGLASTTAIANSTFGLSMESGNNGWLTTGSTNYFNNANNPITGTRYYVGDNTTDPPSFLFYLYHFKNLTETLDLGTVVIHMMAITQLTDIDADPVRLIITVNMSTIIYNTTEYEGTMTPGKKYELFASTTTKITDDSSFSAYYSLYDPTTNLYQPGYKHVLTSNYVFPENTKLTLIDLSLTTPKYYYYVITAADVAAGNQELQTYNEVSYPLSKFIMMDTIGNNTYNDAAMNAQYYDSTKGSLEEFIVQVDFKDAEITTNQVNKYLYPELQNANGNLIIGALAIERPNLQFSVYVGANSTIDVTATIANTSVYNGAISQIVVESEFNNNIQLSETIYDTTYYDDNLGLLIYLTTEELDENNQLVERKVSGNKLMGSYFSIGSHHYYPDAMGDTRLKFADRVGNIRAYVNFNLMNAKIATGEYTIHVEIFGSPDGIHFSNDGAKIAGIDELDVDIILSSYGLKATLNESSLVLVNDGNPKVLSGSVAYTSVLNHANIRLRMYRRSYDTVYSTEYEEVDLADYASDTLTETNVENAYMLISHPIANNTFTVNLSENRLLTGTYRLDFELYDVDALIGKHSLYIVIKDEHYS